MCRHLRLVQIVHRHGDRTPLYNIFEGSSDLMRVKKEMQLWMNVVGKEENLVEMKKNLLIKNKNEHVKDREEQVFGQLTDIGIDQMVAVGKKLRQQYLAFNPLDIEIISTNYQRTVSSAAALINGFTNLTRGTQIQIAQPSQDIINTYAAFPQLVELKKQVQQQDSEFQEKEHNMGPIRRALIHHLPFLDAESFNWMKVADYYVCRDCHNMELVAGTQEFERQCLEHLKYRFHKFYSTPSILELVSTKLTTQIIYEMEKMVREEEEAVEKLQIYSGHDVSILGLLHVLLGAGGVSCSWWPDYASTLAIELYQEKEANTFVVRVCLDNEPLLFQKQEYLGLPQFQALLRDRLSNL